MSEERIGKKIIAEILSYASQHSEDKCKVCNQPGIVRILIGENEQHDYNTWIEHEFVTLCAEHAADILDVIKDIDADMDDITF